MSVVTHARRKRRRKVLTGAMVERLFWRAGFGPSAADRKHWTGKPASALVSWFLSAPATLKGPEPTNDGKPLDIAKNDDDLVLEWVDRMVRTTNPFVERMTFFWHRHLANGMNGGPSPQMIRQQIALYRKYSDLHANPNASFRDLLRDVTIDPSMLRYLTGESNYAGHSNENYAREIMELFVLGIADEKGRKNYTEADVQTLARAFTGWRIDESDEDHPRARFDGMAWANGLKTPFGSSGNYKVVDRHDPAYDATKDPVELVLRRPARPGDAADQTRRPYETHARFLLRKLWHEFIVPEPDAKTMNDLVATYLARSGGVPGLRLKPVLAKILAHPAIFSSIAEPDMVKPPVVYTVGMFRALGAAVTDRLAYDYLDAMGQVPYNPPNVSGWEGGQAWLTTNTALWRFSLAGELMDRVAPKDAAGETAPKAVARALQEIGQPWIAKGTRAAIVDYASRAPSGRPDLRIERQRMIRALALAGPDAQVM
jgi:uncharacterized protein (DUF1800 family)